MSQRWTADWISRKWSNLLAGCIFIGGSALQRVILARFFCEDGCNLRSLFVGLIIYGNFYNQIAAGILWTACQRKGFRQGLQPVKTMCDQLPNVRRERIIDDSGHYFHGLPVAMSIAPGWHQVNFSGSSFGQWQSMVWGTHSNQHDAAPGLGSLSRMSIDE
jgi:hypothetical protein